MSLDVANLLRLLGIRAKRVGRKYKSPCPHPAHNDSDPSWSILENGSHHCFGCSFGGGPWELVQAVKEFKTLEEAGAWLKGEGWEYETDVANIPDVRFVNAIDTKYTLPNGVKIPSFDKSKWFPPAHNYITGPKRRVPEWQLTRWNIGYAITGRCAYRVVVPIFTKGRLVSYVARAFVDDGRPKYDVARRDEPGAQPDLALFGEPAFGDESTITIAEGVFSMLALERNGAINPCAVLGASNLGPEKMSIIAKFKRALVATDPDAAGDKAFEEIRTQLLRYVKVERVRLTASPDDATDAEIRGALNECQVA